MSRNNTKVHETPPELVFSYFLIVYLNNYICIRATTEVVIVYCFSLTNKTQTYYFPPPNILVLGATDSSLFMGKKPSLPYLKYAFSGIKVESELCSKSV